MIALATACLRDGVTFQETSTANRVHFIAQDHNWNTLLLRWFCEVFTRWLEETNTQRHLHARTHEHDIAHCKLCTNVCCGDLWTLHSLLHLLLSLSLLHDACENIVV